MTMIWQFNCQTISWLIDIYNPAFSHEQLIILKKTLPFWVWYFIGFFAYSSADTNDILKKFNGTYVYQT